MLTSAFRFPLVEQATYTIALDPVRSALLSLSLLSADLTDVEVEPWVAQTAAALTPERRERNRLVFQGLGDALLPDTDYPDVPAYLDALEATAPTTLRGRLLAQLGRPAQGGASTLDARQLLDDAQLFLEHIARLSPGAAADEPLLREVHRLLSDPPAMHRLIVEHLRDMYEQTLGARWERQISNLVGFVLVLQQRSLPVGTAADTIRALIGRELPDTIAAQLDGVRQIVFVISPHVRLHAMRFGSPDTIWVFLRAHPATLAIRTAPIKRVELLRPLQALADDTRLHILELLAQHDELPTQEIIARLDQSQPNVSRHIKQLVSAGFVDEQRGEGANKRYRLNPRQIDAAFWTLKQLLSAENARDSEPDARAGQPLALRRFLDRKGRVTSWPAKRQDQDMVLEYLASKLSRSREYAEREVNNILNQWHTYKDHATLRRDLYDARLIDRTRDGARYWRTEESER